MSKSQGALGEFEIRTLPGMAMAFSKPLESYQGGIFPSATPRFLKCSVHACRQWIGFADFVSKTRLDAKTITKIRQLALYAELTDDFAFQLPALIRTLETDLGRLRNFCCLGDDKRRSSKATTALDKIRQAIKGAKREMVRKADRAAKIERSLRMTVPNAPGYHPYLADLLILVLPNGARCRLNNFS